MISATLLLYLAVGTLAMLPAVFIQVWWYKIKLWKSVPITIALTVCGTIGTYIWFFIENRWIGGTSFYGAVFFVPVAFLGVAKLFHLPYHEIIALCAPAECVMLAIMKVQCLLAGCCKGRMLEAIGVRFPSQLAELINALVIFCVLMLLSRKLKNRALLYPLYMLIYGVTRLGLNFFRENQSPFLLGLAPGAFWSICAIVIGCVWLCYCRKSKKKT